MSEARRKALDAYCARPLVDRRCWRRSKRTRTWEQVLELAERLGVRVRFIPKDRLTRRAKELKEEPIEPWIWASRNLPDNAHEAPMWAGWVRPLEVVCEIERLSARGAAQLLHEVGHAVCGMDEADVCAWEIYAALALWGVGASMVREVVHYQVVTIDHDEGFGTDRCAEPGFGRRTRKEARRRFKAHLPPITGPDPRRDRS